MTSRRQDVNGPLPDEKRIIDDRLPLLEDEDSLEDIDEFLSNL